MPSTRSRRKASQRLSIRQIAQQIGTSHTALLHHFGSKDALLEAVLLLREQREGPERADLLRAKGLLDAVPDIMAHKATMPRVIQLDAVLRTEASPRTTSPTTSSTGNRWSSLPR